MLLRRCLMVFVLFGGTAMAQAPFDPAQSPLPHFQAEAVPARPGPRLKVQFNPAPFAREHLNQPDLAPSEPRDGPFSPRGELQHDGPNTKAFWQANRDLDLSATWRVNSRTNLMLGYSPAARGRFTPVEPGSPRVLFLQVGRRW